MIKKKNLNIEIIISDDGSTDQTKHLIKENSYLYDKLIINEKIWVKVMQSKKLLSLLREM